MAKKTDITKLAPVVTLAPGVTLVKIEGTDYRSQYVDYTGIAEIGEYSFKNQLDFIVITPDGKTVKYKFLAVVIGAV